MKLLFCLVILLFSVSGTAQDLVYKPRNPAFGGDTFNYQWMIGSAESQNKFKDKVAERDELTELQQFTEDLNSQLLSAVSRSLFTQQFGTEGISAGSYTFGSLAVEIYPSSAGLTVDILDTKTGEKTQVIIPN
jgi:curli production assembly/transport component CsgF